jgi:hypothetical protein
MKGEGGKEEKDVTMHLVQGETLRFWDRLEGALEVRSSALIIANSTHGWAGVGAA